MSEIEVPAEGLPASSKYTTRELGRLLSWYKKHVKDYGPKVPLGVMKNIQTILDKGIALDDIVAAMKNYAEARKDQDPTYTMGVRSFFSEEKVRFWLNPPPQRQSFRPRPVLPEIAFAPLVRPEPAQPLQQSLIPEEDDWTL